MSSGSSSRASLIGAIAGDSRRWTSTAIDTSGPTASRIAPITAAQSRIVADESTGSVASSGATFIAVNPAATIARAEIAYSSGVVPRGPFAYRGIRSRQAPPSRAYTGSPAALPAMS